MTSATKLDARALTAVRAPVLSPSTSASVLVVGGADSPGAAMLASEGALRGGARHVRLAAAEADLVGIAAALPELRLLRISAIGEGDLARGATKEILDAAALADAVVFGAGMAEDVAASQLATRLLQKAPNGSCFIFTGGALEALRAARNPPRLSGGRLIAAARLTDMAMLSGWTLPTVLADPAGVARETAMRLHAVVIAHGVDRHVAAPDGRTWTHHGTAPLLAADGAGDVLAGFVAGLAARGYDPLEAALTASLVLGAAGEELAREAGAVGMLGRDLAARLPRALAKL